MSEEKKTILYVDDEAVNLAGFKALLRRDFIVHAAYSAKEGLEILKVNKVDIIVSDQSMPEMTGVEFLEIAAKEYPDTRRIILSGYAELKEIEDAKERGDVHKFLSKPLNVKELKKII